MRFFKRMKAKRLAKERKWDALAYVTLYYPGSVGQGDRIYYWPKPGEPTNEAPQPENVQYSIDPNDTVREPWSIEDYYAWESAREQTETFSAAVLRLMEERDMTSRMFYGKADLDRKLFSKLKTDSSYQPNKKTAIRCCLALELAPEEAIKLLGCAGYTLASANPFDLAIRYCIESRIYDLMEVNALLDVLCMQTL